MDVSRGGIKIGEPPLLERLGIFWVVIFFICAERKTRKRENKRLGLREIFGKSVSAGVKVQ